VQKNDETYRVFVESCQEHLDRVEQGILDMERDGHLFEQYDAIYRSLHTLKGDARTFGLPKAVAAAHNMESRLEALRAGGGSLTKADVDDLLRRLDMLRIKLS
jgi:chemotaxis protein histidine kinase CheA